MQTPKSLTAWNPIHSAEHSSSECPHSIESLKCDQIPTWFTQNNHLSSGIRYGNALTAIIIFIRMHSSRMLTVCSSSRLSQGGLPQCMLGYQPPREQGSRHQPTPPRAGSPPRAGTPPQELAPLPQEQTHLGAGTPRSRHLPPGAGTPPPPPERFDIYSVNNLRHVKLYIISLIHYF